VFCPQCKTEYRQGFSECSDCGVALVESLDSAEDPTNQDLALAWRGSDPAGFSAATAALEGAGIRSYPISDHDQIAWGLAIPRPRYGILVRKSDLSEAQDLVSSIEEGAPLSYAKEMWRSPSAPEEAGIAETAPEQEAPSDAQVPDDITEEIKSADATSQVWSGEAQAAETFRLCLRENGIPCAIDVLGDTAKVRVLPEHEARAKEIIREVIEATPPE
jgi:hypothetical protein